MTGVRYRLFNQNKEDPGLVFELFETVYGTSTAIQRRWAWEILCHPQKEDVRIYVAENYGKLVGITVRMPYQIMIGDNIRKAHFASNSMVSPKFRGQGIISDLYDLIRKEGNLQFSKGTTPSLYPILNKIGYREIVPNTYQICILSPFRWFKNKIISRNNNKSKETFGAMKHGEYFRIDKYSKEHATFIDTTRSAFFGGVIKNIHTLNWRYFDIPHLRYHVFVRKRLDEIASMVVLRLEGHTVYLVDILWEKRFEDEPMSTIQFAKYFSRTLGATKLVFWGTLASLRMEMRKLFFFEQADSPRFSFYSTDKEINELKWDRMHFVHGDGDIEYL